MKLYKLNARRSSKRSPAWWEMQGIFSSLELAQKHGSALVENDNWMRILNMEVAELELDNSNYHKQVAACHPDCTGTIWVWKEMKK